MQGDEEVFELTSGDKILIIAEIGTAHGGSLSRARDLIDAAVESGANCVKFQVVFADEIVHPRTGLVDLPGGEYRSMIDLNLWSGTRISMENLKSTRKREGLCF